MQENLTLHAKKRLQERSITIELVRLLLVRGTREHIGSGIVRRSFPRRDQKKIAREISDCTPMNLDKALNCYLLQCSETGTVITVAKRFQQTRFRRH